MLSETRPLSHGITAAFGSVYITDEDDGLKIVPMYRRRLRPIS